MSRALSGFAKKFYKEYKEIMGEDKNNFKHWIVGPNNSYLPTQEPVLIDEIPSGLYKIMHSQKHGYYPVQQEIKTDELLELPIKEIKSIITDIKKFWAKEKMFKKYDLVHKRGVFLYGPAGCGKTCVIQLIINHLINQKQGVVFNISSPNDLEKYMQFVPNVLRVIEPNRPIVTIIEDLDTLVSNHSAESYLLNLLDGNKQMGRIVYVATSNYPERIKERFLNRPSRFDRRYKIDLPIDKVRKFYFENKLEKDDLKKIDINRWVKASSGLTLAHLREMIVSIIVLGNDFNETIDRLKDLKKIPSSTEDRTHSMGFSIDEDIDEDVDEGPDSDNEMHHFKYDPENIEEDFFLTTKKDEE